MLNTAPKILVIFFCIVAFLFLSHTRVGAQQKGLLEVNPAYIDISIGNPQTSQEIEITYTNKSSEPISLEIFPIDFKQSSPRGEISFIGGNSDTYSYSLSSFLSFNINQIQLAPNSSESVLVTVTNRPDLSPGGHYAAVVARDSRQEGTNPVSPALSSLLFLRKIGGERYNISVRAIGWPKFPVQFLTPDVLELTFQNEGNIHVIPYGRIEIRDMFGRLTHKGVINSDSLFVFPETRRILEAELKSVAFQLPIAFNTLSVKGSDSLKKTSYVYSESYVSVHPAFILLLGGGGVIGWAYTVKKRVKKRS